MGTKCSNECPPNNQITFEDAAVIPSISAESSLIGGNQGFCFFTEPEFFIDLSFSFNSNTQECNLYSQPIPEHLTIPVRGSTVITSCACPLNDQRLVQSAAVTPISSPDIQIRGTPISYEACIILCGSLFGGCLTASYDFSSQVCNLYGRLMSEDMLVPRTESRVVLFCRGRQSNGGIMINEDELNLLSGE